MLPAVGFGEPAGHAFDAIIAKSDATCSEPPPPPPPPPPHDAPIVVWMPRLCISRPREQRREQRRGPSFQYDARANFSLADGETEPCDIYNSATDPIQDREGRRS